MDFGYSSDQAGGGITTCRGCDLDLSTMVRISDCGTDEFMKSFDQSEGNDKIVAFHIRETNMRLTHS